MLFPLPIAPLPQNSQEKDSSEPFPCQNRPCGCRSAEQCWKKCCCFDNDQKIAWAKANNVKVPGYVLAAAKKEAKKSASCCEHCAKKTVAVAKPPCCKQAEDSNDATSIAAKQDSCEETVVSVPKSPEVKSKPSKPLKSKWVLAIYAAACQGQGPSAFCFPISIVPDRLLVQAPSVEVIETFAIESERLETTSLRPPLPPPKIV